MASLTHRERVLRALSRQEPDRVPLDLGGSLSTTITVPAYEKLKQYLNITSETVIFDQRGQTALPDEEVLRRFDIDTRALQLGTPDAWPVKFLADGSYQDEWGVVRKKPADGHYYVAQSPLEGEPTLADLERHPWPDPHDSGRTRGLRAKAEALRQVTDYALVLTLPVGIIHQSQFLRGYEDWLADLLLNQPFAEALMDKCLEIWLEIAKDALKSVGDLVDVVFIGDDIAFQDRGIMSLEMYRRLIKPRHRAMFDLVKRNSTAKIMYHSCGSVYAYLPDLVEMGIDALNPVQVAARDMDTRRLKREFGRELCFWGAIDTQEVLPRGTPDDVRREVKQRIEDLAPGGGYILAAVHNLQAGMSPENICAMFDAAREYGRYD